MTLAAWQFTFGSLTWGPGSANPAINTKAIRGLRDMPALRTADSPHLRNPGDYFGIDVIAPRSIEIDLEVIDTAGANFETDLTNVETAFTPLQSTTSAFTFQLPSQAQNRTCQARCRNRTYPIDVTYLFGYAALTVHLVAPDPRIYDVTTTTTNVTTTQTATNAGDFETRPVVTFTSPAAGTTLTNAGDASGFLKLQVLSGFSMPGTVIADFNAQTITDNSGNNRMDLMDPSSTWFKLNPGANSLTITGGGSASVAFQNAWMM